MENRQTEGERDELEGTVQTVRSETGSQTLISHQRLQRSTVEYDQVVGGVAGEKERIGNEVYRLLEELINFKTSVESTLADLEGAFAMEQQ